MSFDLVKVIHEMGFFALAIAGTLIAMAIAALAVFVERLWAFARSRARSRDFAGAAASLLERGDLESLQLDAEAAGKRGAHLGQLLGAGVRTYREAARKARVRVAPVELARRELLRRIEAINAELRRGLNVLASVGSVAPFVGLLGTVVGIITAFKGIAKEGSGGLGAVSAGIAEALVVTALGLFVAIPTVLAFNYLNARVEGILLALEQAQGELIDLLESGAEDAPAGKAEKPAHANGSTRAAKEPARGRAAEPATA